MIALEQAAAPRADLERNSGRLPHADAPVRRLREVPLRQEVELVSIDLPPDTMIPLLERGLVPGCRLCPLRHSPAGDPILLVDGVVIALRREMAECLCVREIVTDAA
jgi:Fe2+ transport system protein FeoA